MYKIILILFFTLSILEYKPLLSLAPSSQINNMFKADIHSAQINNMFKADTHSAQMTMLKRFGSLNDSAWFGNI